MLEASQALSNVKSQIQNMVQRIVQRRSLLQMFTYHLRVTASKTCLYVGLQFGKKRNMLQESPKYTLFSFLYENQENWLDAKCSDF